MKEDSENIRCKVCRSPNCKTYELERGKGRKYLALAMIASRSYGEKISARQFKNHFEGHGIEEFGREVIT